MSRIRYVSFCTRLTYSKKSNETDKQQLISLYKKNYQDSERNVNEFEQEYTSEKALWRYTREIFLHRMLNKALRVQNIDLLFLFRFVIGDIYRQLKQNQCQSSVRVYRGQLILNDELERLRRSIGYPHPSIKWKRAMFIIDADPRVVT